MRLLRVQVPEFRALKDVDISFEPDFVPQVFPLGSLNGGGKSTLLQLVFVLLHSFSNEKDESYLKNIAKLINNYDTVELANLAKISLLTSYGKLNLDYFYGNQKDIKEALIDIKNKHDCFSFPIKITGFFINMYLMDYPKIGNTWEELGGANNILKKIQEEITNNIFLISPSNQPYLFLSREERRALFSKDNKPQYDQSVRNAQGNLPNFFTFDFADVLVEIFRRARAKDFKERNKNNPFFHTEKLESDINSIFIDGKKINSLIIEQQRHTQDEIQGLCFRLYSGEIIYTEDLSDGELKRLTIFVLMKYYEIKDAIVLIDEIENALHPDWQRHIVDDLVEWGASNQYVLATHSYELCRGVTPAHVKELAPNLLPEN